MKRRCLLAHRHSSHRLVLTIQTVAVVCFAAILVARQALEHAADEERSIELHASHGLPSGFLSDAIGIIPIKLDIIWKLFYEMIMKDMLISNPSSSKKNQWFDAHTVMPDHCDSHFGYGFIRRWSAAEQLWCSPSMTCHAIDQTDRKGGKELLCTVDNAIVDLSIFSKMSFMRAMYHATNNTDDQSFRLKLPALSNRCSKIFSEWRDDHFPRRNGRRNHTLIVDGLGIDRDVDCRDAEARPLLIIQGQDLTDFHSSYQSLFNAFNALLITGLRPDEVRVLLADLYPWGPFEAFWRRLFPDIRTVWEAQAEPPRCHRKIVLGMYGPASPHALHSQITPCRHSPLVRAYAHWALHVFDLVPRRRPEPGERLRLLWMSRRPRRPRPERSHCGDHNPACVEWAHLGVRQIERVLDNDVEVVAALGQRPELHVTSAGFSAPPFAQQVAEAAAADILVGPHGAGLTHLLFLPDWACVVELKSDDSGNKYHYANLAAWRGLTYAGVSFPSPVPPVAVVETVRDTCVALIPSPASARGGG
jgi:hypothetical protein